MKPSTETREKVKALTDQLEAGVKAVFESERYQAYLKAMSKFHRYSFGNVLLILMQRPEASMVAGYTTWKKQFGRTVKKGEHGIQIIAPIQGSRLIKQDRLDPDTQRPVIGPDGLPEKEPIFVSYQSFRVAYVFDVSQTEGKELPSLGVGELSGEIEHFERIFAAVEALSPVPVEYRPAQKSKGCYNHLEQKISLNQGMSQVQTLKTLIHETAHALLHALPVKDGKITGKPEKDKHTREVEAESIAYVVCQHFGIDTSDYSFPYVTGWSSGKELDELKASLECISKTAAEMIDGIERTFPELAIDKAERPKGKYVSR
ncbi:MAG: ArdC-like ssDNA-binding domain-containing protein [Candidatus Limivicinus sp.]